MRPQPSARLANRPHPPEDKSLLLLDFDERADGADDADGRGAILLGDRVGSLFGLIGLLVAVPLAAALGVLLRFAIRKYGSSASAPALGPSP